MLIACSLTYTFYLSSAALPSMGTPAIRWPCESLLVIPSWALFCLYLPYTLCILGSSSIYALPSSSEI